MTKEILRYIVPIFLFLLGLRTLRTKEGEAIATNVPIIPGEYKIEVAVVFFVLSGLLSFIIYRYSKSGGK